MPLLMVPPVINKFYIMDIAPGPEHYRVLRSQARGELCHLVAQSHRRIEIGVSTRTARLFLNALESCPRRSPSSDRTQIQQCLGRDPCREHRLWRTSTPSARVTGLPG